MPKNAAEQFVSELCSRSFLSLWSYPNPQGKNASKELCDFLVVCDPDIIVFSVKEIAFKDTGSPEVDLQRWQREAIDKSVKQVYGAERQLGLRGHVVTQKGEAGLTLPDKSVRRLHRVAVILGGEHQATEVSRDYGKGYVHVFDRLSCGKILQELDTISDFVAYLRAKEELIASLLIEGGEEDLLAFYLHNGRTFPAGPTMVIVEQGLWQYLCKRKEFRARKEADRPSYAWDKIIDVVGQDAVEGRLLGRPSLDETEEAIRVMARENRFSRRSLGQAYADFLEANRTGQSRSRIAVNEGYGLATYVFLGCPLGTTRNARCEELGLRCFVARGFHPENDTVVGIATETPRGEPGFSLDLVHLRKSSWTEKDAEDARSIQEELGYFANMKVSRVHEDEYPEAGGGRGQ